MKNISENRSTLVYINKVLRYEEGMSLLDYLLYYIPSPEDKETHNELIDILTHIPIPGDTA